MSTAEPRIRPLSAADVLSALQAEAATLPLALGPGELSGLRLVAAGQAVLVVAFDYARHQGSIGVQEASQLVQAFGLARRERLPLVLLLETSGIRVTDETAGIASLRRVLREALDARLDGVRLLALVLRSAFGGASLLACLCERRVLHADTLLAMSGPKLIEQSVGSARFAAGDRAAVVALIGGAARAALSDRFRLVAADAAAYVRALHDWLQEPAAPAPDLAALWGWHQHLAARLVQRAPTVSANGQDEDGQDEDGQDEVMQLSPGSPDGPRTLALHSRDGTGAGAALTLARELLAPAMRGEAPVATCIDVDAQSHAATPGDEAVLLSEVLAHLALVIRALHRGGRPVEVRVTGRGGGGIQGALGGAASSVTMTAQARLSVLPQAALQALNKAEDADAGAPETALRVGAVDRVVPAAAGRAPWRTVA